MTDQIYYKIQYPIKKAMTSIKAIDLADISAEDFDEQDIEELRNLLERWNDGGAEEIKELILKLRNL